MGHSLGALYGTVALVNKKLSENLVVFDSMFAFKTANINVSAGGTFEGLIDSPFFDPVVKGSLLVASSLEFVEFLTDFSVQNGIPVEVALGPAFLAFEKLLSPELAAVINATFPLLTSLHKLLPTQLTLLVMPLS
jgi:hypothetical protein